MIGIYKIENLINQKIYIGQSIDIKERYKQHIYKAFNKNEAGYNQIIHLAFRKYGIENFKLEVLEECALEELDEKEQYWITKLNTITPNGYNILPGGQRCRALGKKISITKGKSIIIRRCNRRKTCPICGAPMSSNAKVCLNCYLKDKSKHLPSAEELKEKLIVYNGNFVQVAKLYNVTDNAIRKWCKKYNMPYHTNDYKVKLQKKPNKISVDQLNPNTGEIIQTFESADAAARFLGKKRGSHITEACKGKLNIVYGYKWQYHK